MIRQKADFDMQPFSVNLTFNQLGNAKSGSERSIKLRKSSWQG